MPFGTLKNTQDLKALEEQLAHNSYVAGAYPTTEDFDVFSRVKLSVIAKSKEYASILRWFKHIQTFTDEDKKAFPQSSKKSKKSPAPKAAPAAAPAQEESDEDDFDLFGEETAEEKAAKEATAAKVEAKKIDYSKAKAAKNVINKNSLVFDVIPGDSEVDFEQFFKKITAIEMEGLQWGESMKVVPMCFGLKKMQVCATVLDSVDTEKLTENILITDCDEEKAKNRLALRDAGDDEDDEEEYYVLNCEIVSFQKL